MTVHHLKTGRNDLCPCGSGKKHKKCCRTTSEDVLDFSWRKIRQTEGELLDDLLLPYVKSHLPRETMNAAFEDFMNEEEASEETKELLFHNMFIPWFLFNWIPSIEYVPEKEIGLQYLEKRMYKLTPYQKRMLEAYCESYYSFYCVLDVIPQKSICLKDIFLGTEHTIKEKQGTQFLERGHIVFTRLVCLDDQSISSGMLPYVISSRYHLQLIDVKDSLKKMFRKKTLTPALMRDVDNELRAWALQAVLHEHDNPLPEMRNTDNEPMEFCKVHFKLKVTPEEALSMLLPLTLYATAEEILADAKRDKQGDIERLEFSWLKKGNEKMKSWDNTVMAHITIEKVQLIIAVNSRARAEKIQSLVKDLLQEDAVYQNTLIETLDQVMSSEESVSSTPIESLNHLPEVQAHLQHMSKQHWSSWLDEPLPALEGKTPRKASLTAKGRERLEALLLDFEAHNARKPHDPMNPDITYLKKQLGLL